MGADRPPAPSRGTRSVCAFSCRLCPECVEADGRPDGSRLGGASAQRPARLGPVICPWRWGPAAAPGVRAGVRFGAAAPRFECRVFAPRTACNVVDVYVKKKTTNISVVCVHHGCVLGHVRARSALRQGSEARAGKTGRGPGASLGAERVPQCGSQTDRQVRTEGPGTGGKSQTHSLVSWRGRAVWPGLGLHGHPPALLQTDVAVRRGRRGPRSRVKVKTRTPRGARRDFLKDPRLLAPGSARPRRPPRPPRPTGVRERGAGPFPQPRSASGLRTPLSGAAAAPGARGAPLASPCAARRVRLRGCRRLVPPAGAKRA